MRAEGELGRGAFGAVYRMKHRKKGTVMAVKVSSSPDREPPPTYINRVKKKLGMVERKFFLFFQEAMCFVPQKIRATIDDDERRRLMMDVNVACKSLDCPYTVTFYGSLFHDVSVCSLS